MKRLMLALLLSGCVLRTEHAVVTSPLLGSGPWAVHVVSPGAPGHGGSDGVVLADLTGDGRRDLVGAWELDSLVTAHLRPADPLGEQWPELVVASHLPGAEGVDVAAAEDLDDDGHPDLVALSEAGGVHVWTTRAAPLRGGQLPGSTPSDRWLTSALLDLEGDGDVDLVAGGETSRVYAWRSAGPLLAHDPSMWIREYVAEAKHVMRLLPRELSGDTLPDLIVAERYGLATTPGPGVWWAEGGTGDGDDVPWTPHLIDVGRRAMIAGVGDVDGDEDEDLVVPYARDATYPPALRWYEWTGDGDAWITHDVPLPPALLTRDTKGVAIGDLDLDGDADLVLTAHGGAFLVWIALQDEAGGWAWQSIDPSSYCAKVDEPHLEDLDQDGDLDVLISEEARVVDGAAVGRGIFALVNPLVPAEGGSP